MNKCQKKLNGIECQFGDGHPLHFVLSVEKLERRVALLENGRLEEYSVERSDSRNIVGSVYKGKVKNIEMGLKAMFVDIGFEKNAFLHFWDAIPAALDSSSRSKLDKLRNAKPGDFTGQYDPMQVSAHKDAVSLFERYAKGGEDPKLKDWAGETLPALQHHLEMAQNLGKTK